MIVDVAVLTNVPSEAIPIAIPVPLKLPEKLVAVTYPTTSTEVYAFKSGGASGTTVSTVTLTYSDSTKAELTTVART